MAPELRRHRAYTAPIDSERCIAKARTAVKGEGARCMHRAVKATRYCRQHALHASPSPGSPDALASASVAQVPAGCQEHASDSGMGA
jgi:hypothetical protein